MSRDVIAEMDRAYGHITATLETWGVRSVPRGRSLSDLAREVSSSVDLECTGEDDHDSPECPKCDRIRRRIERAIATAPGKE